MQRGSQKWRCVTVCCVVAIIEIMTVQSDDTEADLTRTWKYLDVGKDGILLYDGSNPADSACPLGFMNEEQFLLLMASDWEAHV